MTAQHVREDFGRKVLWRAAHGLGKRTLAYDTRETKVRELDLVCILGLQQNVLRFQIAVRNALCVQIINRISDLLKDATAAVLREATERNDAIK